jgi:hypothetical protein
MFGICQIYYRCQIYYPQQDNNWTFFIKKKKKKKKQKEIVGRSSLFGWLLDIKV